MRISLLISLLLLLPVFPESLPLNTWPRDVDIDSGVITVYQPQIDSLEKNVIKGRAAVAFRSSSDAEPIFGAIWLEGAIEVDRSANTVRFRSLSVTEARFPEGSEAVGEAFQKKIKESVSQTDLVSSLDQIKTSLAASMDQQEASEELKMDPPKIVVENEPALLVSIDGKPVFQKIEGTDVDAVQNTPYPLFKTDVLSYHLNAAPDLWYKAQNLKGPWSYDPTPPDAVASLVNPPKEQKGDTKTYTAQTAPKVLVVTEPTELVVTDGTPSFEPITPDLLAIENSDTPVFMNVKEQRYYLNVSGRWYRAKSMKGSWDFIPSERLPETFQQIPADSDYADVRAYIAGTDEAHEAVMDASIPQTAAVKRGTVTLEVLYDGEPSFKKVDGTKLTYAVNASETVLASGKEYYLVKDGVWYLSSSPTGPWEVSDHAPPGIAGVKPSSPVYNTKFVYVYDATPNVVYVGYTPGYMCSYIYGPTIVYGTGWYYSPWIGPVYYYPRHATWGFRVNYNSVTGWGFGLTYSSGPFTFGWYAGGGWRGYPWYGPALYGPGRYRPGISYNDIDIDRNLNINVDRNNLTNNLYARKDQIANVRDNFERPIGTPGNPVKGPTRRDNLPSRPQNLPERSDRNNVFTDRNGNVYKKDGDQWAKQTNGSWENIDRSRLPTERPNLNRTPPELPSTARPIERPDINAQPPSLQGGAGIPAQVLWNVRVMPVNVPPASATAAGILAVVVWEAACAAEAEVAAEEAGNPSRSTGSTTSASF